MAEGTRVGVIAGNKFSAAIAVNTLVIVSAGIVVVADKTVLQLHNLAASVDTSDFVALWRRLLAHALVSRRAASNDLHVRSHVAPENVRANDLGGHVRRRTAPNIRQHLQRCVFYTGRRHREQQKRNDQLTVSCQDHRTPQLLDACQRTRKR